MQRLNNTLGAKRKNRNTPDEGAGSQSVNMLKRFWVISASDLAFDPGIFAKPRYNADQDDWMDVEEDICFPETTFYVSLLTVVSISMISRLVSVFYIW